MGARIDKPHRPGRGGTARRWKAFHAERVARQAQHFDIDAVDRLGPALQSLLCDCDWSEQASDIGKAEL